MSHRWIFEVLADLESYALHNDLPRLAAKLSDAARIAAGELSETSGQISAPPVRRREPLDSRPGD